MSAFEYKMIVRMHHTDAAGRIFFGDQFQIAHDAYEQFMYENGLKFGELLLTSEYAIPIVHAEADYKTQLFVSDEIVVSLTLKHVKNSSFILHYDLLRSGEVVGTVETTHVFLSRKTGQPIPIAKDFLQVLELLY